MENLRWILIFAGVGILLALWLSGRAGSRRDAASRSDDPLLRKEDADERAGPVPTSAGTYRGGAPLDAFDDGFGTTALDDFDDLDADDLARPGEPGHAVRVRHESGARAEGRARTDQAESQAPGAAAHAFGSLSQKFEAIGEKLAPKRRARVASSEPAAGGRERAERPFASEIVTLHVAAPAGEILPPEALYEQFRIRGYEYGEKSIFHSTYEGKTVFSILRMINPGTFDLDDITTFETPGIAMILQLPGPVAADTAFEVMLSEAREMADELGASVLDGARSTLGRQTEQHLREGIYEYMHRQKYFDSVAS